MKWVIINFWDQTWVFQIHKMYICSRGPEGDVKTDFFFVLFDSLRPLNNLSVMRDGSSWV